LLTHKLKENNDFYKRISLPNFSFLLMEIQARLVLAVVCGEEMKGKRRKCRSK
jgi:hypothetical protein